MWNHQPVANYGKKISSTPCLKDFDGVLKVISTSDLVTCFHDTPGSHQSSRAAGEPWIPSPGYEIYHSYPWRNPGLVLVFICLYIFSDPLGSFMYVYICLKPAKVAGLLEFSLPFAVKNMPNTTNIVAWQKSIYDDLERKRLTYADLPPVKSNMELGDLNRSNMASSNI